MVHSELVWKLLLIEEAPEKETQAPRAGCLLVFSVLHLGQRCVRIVLSDFHPLPPSKGCSIAGTSRLQRSGLVWLQIWK